jgi:hypothetical protein
MNREHRDQLIATYVKRFASDSPNSLSMGKDEDNPTFWAYSELADIVVDRPLEAFELVLEILAATDDENVLQVLAAGPLEELIHHHGLLVIDAIEREATKNPRLIGLLTGVWKTGPQEVWERIEALITSH